MPLKLPFGLKDDVLLDISQVERGLACGCLCPACGDALVARKGLKVSHHFAHKGAAECSTGLQTALHLAGKEILAKRKRMRLPRVVASIGVGYGRTFDLYDSTIVEFDEVFLESPFEGLIPDIIGKIKGRTLLIEIAVTHFMSSEKLARLSQMDVSVIEIDLSKVERLISFEDLERILIDGVDHKRWILNSKKSAFAQNVRQFGIERKVVDRRFASHIDDCPLKRSKWKGRSYANLIDDCSYCEYLLDVPGNDQSSPTRILCGGHAKKEIENLVEGSTIGGFLFN